LGGSGPSAGRRSSANYFYCRHEEAPDGGPSECNGRSVADVARLPTSHCYPAGSFVPPPHRHSLSLSLSAAPRSYSPPSGSDSMAGSPRANSGGSPNSRLPITTLPPAIFNSPPPAATPPAVGRPRREKAPHVSPGTRERLSLTLARAGSFGAGRRPFISLDNGGASGCRGRRRLRGEEDAVPSEPFVLGRRSAAAQKSRGGAARHKFGSCNARAPAVRLDRPADLVGLWSLGPRFVVPWRGPRSATTMKLSRAGGAPGPAGGRVRGGMGRDVGAWQELGRRLVDGW
jgi:hypothetical protein